MGECCLDVLDDLGLRGEVGSRHGFDGRDDPLAGSVVWDSHDAGIDDERVALEHLLNFFWIDLLTGGVDALAAPPEQLDRPVDPDPGVVTWHAVPGSVDHAEGGVGLGSVLVVAERVAPAECEHPYGVGARGDVYAVLVDDADLRAEGELPGGGSLVGGGDRATHAEGFGRGEGIDEHHCAVVCEESLLNLL